MAFFFFDEDKEYAGGVGVYFRTPPTYGLGGCSQFSHTFATSLPAELDKDWAFAKRGKRVKVYCNEELVGVLEANSESCKNLGFLDTWDEHWNRQPSQLYFAYGSAPDAYYIGWLMNYNFSAHLILLI